MNLYIGIVFLYSGVLTADLAAGAINLAAYSILIYLRAAIDNWKERLLDI